MKQEWISKGDFSRALLFVPDHELLVPDSMDETAIMERLFDTNWRRMKQEWISKGDLSRALLFVPDHELLVPDSMDETAIMERLLTPTGAERWKKGPAKAAS